RGKRFPGSGFRFPETRRGWLAGEMVSWFAGWLVRHPGGLVGGCHARWCRSRRPTLRKAPPSARSKRLNVPIEPGNCFFERNLSGLRSIPRAGNKAIIFFAPQGICHQLFSSLLHPFAETLRKVTAWSLAIGSIGGLHIR